MIKRLLIVPLFSILLGCGSKEPSKNEIIGIWRSNDGGTLVLNKNGTFKAVSLPANIFFFEYKHGNKKNTLYNGNGSWDLIKDKSEWQVLLDFKETSININHYGLNLLVAGGKGILEDNPPWYLYLWKGEEGGDRYEFKKQ